MIKLNLGSGVFYKPGYINIDLSEQDVADEIQNVANLKFESNSVDVIEASHILEHFDIIHLPYVLAEWFRVLKTDGKLCIETPNLVKSIISLKPKSDLSKKLTYQFLFGIDFEGNVHKIGFTTRFLKKYLTSAGFTKISKQKQKSFKSEKSIRYCCKKPAEIPLTNTKFLINHFRTLITNCISLFSKLKLNNDMNNLSDELCLELIASLTLFSPKVAKIFVELFSDNLPNYINFDVLDYLDSIDFSSKMYENWKSWRKNKDKPKYDVFYFYNHWISKIKKSLLSETKIDVMYNFIESLERSEYDYFCFELVDILSLRKSNQGLRYFSNKNFEKAKELFLEALKLQPYDPVSNWNLARLSINSENKEKLLIFYKQAIMNALSREHKKKIKKEIHLLKNGNEKLIPLEPIQIRF
ncbi:MAG: methyltransferase domain-containing protein [Candidatus Heimdallarchaeota archaeon]